ncbi:NADH-quinone oxidoreductase subunit E [Marinobacterium nitratireducens]|uniref:NADH-quinone oxidoreductase subunit E n=1 Tax=Marinobacterium nitratireducens TaxID=518897 RepID=A0A918DQ72_9GAMM|nr:NADH-quinone oxidoreductase subunit NuoE [Marinobacterium nitratireducens]GGO78153.1 NADH-quinone oxidoreductase subunit E [Marinobacterium nitratireducens]
MAEVFARDTGWSQVYLSDEERAEIEREAECYPRREGLCIEALRIVQRHRGWVSDHSLAAIADYLNVDAAEVESVATFYNLIYRRPVGRRVILLCNSVTCWMLGCETLRTRIQAELGIDFGETSADGEFTLLPVTCLGDCDHAPAALIGDRHHHDLDPDRIVALLRQSREDE